MCSSDLTNAPSYAQVAVSGKNDHVWAAQTDSDVRTLQRAGSTSRLAACWYSGGSFDIDVNVTDQASHKLTLYLLDWDAINRVTRIDVLDGSTGQVLSSQTVQAYQQGVYLSWNVQGHLIVRVTTVGGVNAVVSGVFFDPAN